MSTRIDDYKGVDGDSKLTIELDMTTIAQQVAALNYGAHRLLSALVHELRRKNMAYVERTRAKDSTLPHRQRLNLPPERERSPLADAIEAALNAGHTY